MRSPAKQKLAIALFVSLLLVTLAVAVVTKLRKPSTPEDQTVHEEKVQLENKQSISVFHVPQPEKGLLIFISDDIHHKTSYANQFAQLSYTVAVLDSKTLLANAAAEQSCTNLASYLSDLRKELQTHFDLDQDNLPILVGSDEGAALVYDTLAQAEATSFHAGISINFKAGLPTSTKPLCAINNFAVAGTLPTAAKHLPASWYIFQEKALAQDTHTAVFTDQVSNARLTIADNPGQPPLTEAIQVLQWLDPRLTDQISSDQSDSELPLIEVTRDTAEANTSDESQSDKDSLEKVPDTKVDALPDTMAVLLTGDGGWAEIDKHIARLLADKGIPTVALDSLSYFWKTRTPVDTASDIETVINQYRAKWQKQRVILIGYSFGADVLPFIANKLQEETQKHIALVALLGMGKTAAFEFRLSSWVDADKSTNRLPLPPELKAMTWAKSVCIYGVDDPETQCANTAELGVKPISMTGDHHFDEKYEELVQHIIDNAKP